MPGANDFLEAFTGLGYRAPGSARPKKTRGTKGASSAAEQPAAYSGPWPQLTHLRLLLRLLVPICRGKVSRSQPVRASLLLNAGRTWQSRAAQCLINNGARDVTAGPTFKTRASRIPSLC